MWRPPERIKGDYIRLCKKSDTQIIQQERGTPWDNRAEGHVGIIKSLVKTDLKEFNYPMVHLSNDTLIIWFYAAERRANIISSFSRNIYELRGQVPYTKATGYETDISALAELKYYFPIFIRETSSMLRSIWTRGNWYASICTKWRRQRAITTENSILNPSWTSK